MTVVDRRKKNLVVFRLELSPTRVSLRHHLMSLPPMVVKLVTSVKGLVAIGEDTLEPVCSVLLHVATVITRALEGSWAALGQESGASALVAGRPTDATSRFAMGMKSSCASNKAGSGAKF
jgi:hypothetical protein